MDKIRKINVIPWWNRPITWVVGILILLLALSGLFRPERTPAEIPQEPVRMLEVQPPERTPVVVKEERIVVKPPQIIERTIVVEKPVEKRVVVTEKVPVVVDHYIYVPRDTQTNERCEAAAKEYARRVAKWREQPFSP